MIAIGMTIVIVVTIVKQIMTIWYPTIITYITIIMSLQ